MIVGGGIIGCATAFWLAKAPLVPLVLERDQVGREAAWASAGVVVPQLGIGGDDLFSDFLLAGARLSPLLAEELRATTGMDIEYRKIGILVPFSTQAERRAPAGPGISA